MTDPSNFQPVIQNHTASLNNPNTTAYHGGFLPHS